MMTAGLHLVLLMFALIGFAGAGASLAVARTRQVADGEHDTGMLGVAGMLFVFGTLCTVVGSGLVGVFAFGGVTLWAGYVVTAQRVGLFHIETGWLEEARETEPRQTT
jgi:threonine/homoserine efflux transporter RhtA